MECCLFGDRTRYRIKQRNLKEIRFNMGKKNKIRREVKDLVIARLGVLSPNKKISIGSSGEFTRDELIELVEKENEIGVKIVKIELEYLRAIREGDFYEQNISDYQTKTR